MLVKLTFYYLLRLETNKDEQVILIRIKHHTKNIQKKTFKQWNIPSLGDKEPIQKKKENLFFKEKLNYLTVCYSNVYRILKLNLNRSNPGPMNTQSNAVITITVITNSRL